MWQNATIAALYSRSLHASGNITRLSWHGDLPFSLGDCHAGEVLHPTHDHRSHPQVLLPPSSNTSAGWQSVARFGIYKIVRRHGASFDTVGPTRRRVSPH